MKMTCEKCGTLCGEHIRCSRHRKAVPVLGIDYEKDRVDSVLSYQHSMYKTFGMADVFDGSLEPKFAIPVTLRPLDPLEEWGAARIIRNGIQNGDFVSGPICGSFYGGRPCGGDNESPYIAYAGEYFDGVVKNARVVLDDGNIIEHNGDIPFVGISNNSYLAGRSMDAILAIVDGDEPVTCFADATGVTHWFPDGADAEVFDHKDETTSAGETHIRDASTCPTDVAVFRAALEGLGIGLIKFYTGEGHFIPIIIVPGLHKDGSPSCARMLLDKQGTPVGSMKLILGNNNPEVAPMTFEGGVPFMRRYSRMSGYDPRAILCALVAMAGIEAEDRDLMRRAMNLTRVAISTGRAAGVGPVCGTCVKGDDFFSLLKGDDMASHLATLVWNLSVLYPKVEDEEDEYFVLSWPCPHRMAAWFLSPSIPVAIRTSPFGVEMFRIRQVHDVQYGEFIETANDLLPFKLSGESYFRDWQG